MSLEREIHGQRALRGTVLPDYKKGCRDMSYFEITAKCEESDEAVALRPVLMHAIPLPLATSDSCEAEKKSDHQ